MKILSISKRVNNHVTNFGFNVQFMPVQFLPALPSDAGCRGQDDV